MLTCYLLTNQFNNHSSLLTSNLYALSFTEISENFEQTFKKLLVLKIKFEKWPLSFRIVLVLQKNCKNEGEKSHIPHTQFPLLRTSYMSKIYLLPLMKQYQYIIIK